MARNSNYTAYSAQADLITAKKLIDKVTTSYKNSHMIMVALRSISKSLGKMAEKIVYTELDDNNQSNLFV